MRAIGKPQYQLFESKNYFDKELYLITMSDIIYRNKLGKYKTLIDEEFIKDRLGLESVGL